MLVDWTISLKLTGNTSGSIYFLNPYEILSPKLKLPNPLSETLHSFVLQ
jgi:hypothetical protein